MRPLIFIFPHNKNEIINNIVNEVENTDNECIKSEILTKEIGGYTIAYIIPYKNECEYDEFAYDDNLNVNSICIDVPSQMCKALLNIADTLIKDELNKIVSKIEQFNKKMSLSDIIKNIENFAKGYKYIILENCNSPKDLYYDWIIYSVNEIDKVKKILTNSNKNKTIKAVWLSNSKLIPKILEFIKCAGELECYKSLGNVVAEAESTHRVSIGLHDSEEYTYAEGDDYVPSFMGDVVIEYLSWYGYHWLSRPNVLDNTVLVWEREDKIPETLCNYCYEVYGGAIECEDAGEVIHYEEIGQRNDCEHRDCEFITATLETTGIHVKYEAKRWLTSGFDEIFEEFYVDFTGELKIDTEYHEYEHHYYRNECCGKVSEHEYEIEDGEVVYEREN